VRARITALPPQNGLPRRKLWRNRTFACWSHSTPHRAGAMEGTDDVTSLRRGTLSLVYATAQLVVFGVYLDGHYLEGILRGDFDTRRVAVFDASNGALRCATCGLPCAPPIVDRRHSAHGAVAWTSQQVSHVLASIRLPATKIVQFAESVIIAGCRFGSPTAFSGRRILAITI